MYSAPKDFVKLFNRKHRHSDKTLVRMFRDSYITEDEMNKDLFRRPRNEAKWEWF